MELETRVKGVASIGEDIVLVWCDGVDVNIGLVIGAVSIFVVGDIDGSIWSVESATSISEKVDIWEIFEIFRVTNISVNSVTNGCASL